MASDETTFQTSLIKANVRDPACGYGLLAAHGRCHAFDDSPYNPEEPLEPSGATSLKRQSKGWTMERPLFISIALFGCNTCMPLVAKDFPFWPFCQEWGCTNNIGGGEFHSINQQQHGSSSICS